MRIFIRRTISVIEPSSLRDMMPGDVVFGNLKKFPFATLYKSKWVIIIFRK